MTAFLRRSIAIVLLACAARSSHAQFAKSGFEPLEVNSELEEYLRFAQTMDTAISDPWSIRGFTSGQVGRITSLRGIHPWSARQAFKATESRAGIRLLPLSAGVILNSAFPLGNNDGPVWAGKGLTTVLRAGIDARWKGFSVRLRPTLFRAENAAFQLMANEESGKLRFADGQYPRSADRPQRFGEGAYQRIDPGESTLSLEIFPITVGISTATQSWGPSVKFQFILGNNAGGYPHVFIGSESPINAGIGKVHARLAWGMLEQSAFSSVGGPQFFVDGSQPGRRRFSAGMIATLQPRGANGLELGAGRFFHSTWRSGGPNASDFTALFQNVFKKSLPAEEPLPGTDNTQGVRDNQLFSLFMRWAVPASGFEVYGEFGREDHSYNIRDFLQEPDHGGASRMLGLRKVWKNGYALRTETINYEAPQLMIVRPEGAVYLHQVLRQGHTQNGQPLGADAGLGAGAASTVSLDRYTPNGRTGFSWARTIGHETGAFFQTGVKAPDNPDVLHTLSLDQLRFRGSSDLYAKLSLTANLNRYFRSDVFNIGVNIGTTLRF